MEQRRLCLLNIINSYIFLINFKIFLNKYVVNVRGCLLKGAQDTINWFLNSVVLQDHLSLVELYKILREGSSSCSLTPVVVFFISLEGC